MPEENANPSDTPLSGRLMPEAQLALRWNKTTRTLQRWRAKPYGPPFMVIGRTVFYRTSDIEAFEQKCRRGGDL